MSEQDPEHTRAQREADPRFRTANRVLIVEGLRVWDYDAKPGSVQVGPEVDKAWWNGWFDVQRDDGSRALMNGERLSTVHPYTGKSVPALLVWTSAGTDEPDDMCADSVRRVLPECTSAFYELGPEDQGWAVTLIQLRQGEQVESARVASADTEQRARCLAQLWENDATPGRQASR